MKIKGILLSAGLIFLASCASTPPPPDYSAYVWPKAPQEPKIKLLKIIMTDLDIRESSFLEKLFGEDATFSFSKPHGIAADKEGNIYVSDTRNLSVAIINLDRKELSSLGNPYGWRLPLGVAVDNDNELIAVADGGSAQVYIFDRRDRSIKTIIGQKGELRNPVGVAFDSQRQILYVGDSKNHEISSYTLDGEFISKVSSGAIGDVYFPAQMATDAEGRLFVVDTMNFRVQVLDPKGTQPPKAIGEHGDRPGMFARPKGVAVSDDGYVFTTDAAFGNIQIFDKQGTIYLFIGRTGRAPGTFNIPQHIAIDGKDRVYVVDQINQRVQVFQYLSERYLKSQPPPNPPK